MEHQLLFQLLILLFAVAFLLQDNYLKCYVYLLTNNNQNIIERGWTDLIKEAISFYRIKTILQLF